MYSNGPDVAWLRLDRRVGRLPNRAWDNGPDILSRQLDEDGAVIVYFDGIRRTYLPEPDELATYVDLVVIDEFEDGVVLARARS